MDDAQLQESIYKNMVPKRFLGANDSWRHFNLFMKNSDLNEETSDAIIEAMREKMMKFRLNSYDMANILGHMTVPRTAPQRQFFERGIGVINERLERMHRWDAP